MVATVAMRPSNGTSLAMIAERKHSKLQQVTVTWMHGDHECAGNRRSRRYMSSLGGLDLQTHAGSQSSATCAL